MIMASDDSFYETAENSLDESGVDSFVSYNPKKKVGYVFSEKLRDVADSLKKVPFRASVTHKLIEAYQLINHLMIIEPKGATYKEIASFHLPEYIEELKKLSDQDDVEKYDETAEQYGLCYDCPVFPGVYEYASLIAGGTIAAAEVLTKEECSVAINWVGGWHHAKKDEAAGFCYINDIVLGILKLREKYDKVLYIDLDLHHGDGVEDAFCATPKVFTFSIHKYAAGFFPGSGALNDVGFGKGKYYTANVPLDDGISDELFFRIFQRLISKIKEQFNPSAVVCQCGADGLSGDPMASFNLTEKGLGNCVEYVLNWNLPTLLIGGGGYNIPNTARCWTYLTGVALGVELSQDIPEHKYFTKYGPDYELSIRPGNRKNKQNEDEVGDILNTILDNLDEVR